VGIRKKSAKKTRKKTSWKARLFRFCLISFFVFIFLVLIGSSVIYYVLLQELPSIAALRDFRPSIATQVYSDNDELIDEFFLEDRKIINIADVPRHVVLAFVSAEDARFFHHKGLDFASIIRAFYKNMAAGKIVQGGSTITQQVAKSLYLSPEKSYARKAREAVLAYKIDLYLTKEEILNLYLNYIYMGHGTYGIEAASEGYFGKSARHLTLAEASMLAALPKSPTNYSPLLRFERSRERQNYVLSRMVEDGYITPAQKQEAWDTALQFRSVRPKEKIAPYFIEHVRRYVQSKYGSNVLYKEGLKIYTTLDISAQINANQAVERGLKEIEERGKYKELPQAALLCMDARTGAIRAMVGGRDFKKSEFNRATQSVRQPGSAFKPFIYTAAFDKGMAPATRFEDSPVAYPDRSQKGGFWRPKNADGKFVGIIPLREALVYSRNVVTVKLLDRIGVDYAVSYTTNMGITSPLDRNLSIALGSAGVTLQEMVRAYGVLANSGKRVSPYFIKKIVDRTGHVFEQAKIVEEQVIDPKIAFLTTHVLQDAVSRGTGTRVKSIGRPVAGKTGTTNDYRDAWFIGYTPSYVTGVWVGFDRETTLRREEVGGRAAAPIWLYFMSKFLADSPSRPFPVPEGIVFRNIDSLTGLFTDEAVAGQTTREIFLEGTRDADIMTYADSTSEEEDEIELLLGF
jgi:penicillin-binding protein 1A